MGVRVRRRFLAELSVSGFSVEINRSLKDLGVQSPIYGLEVHAVGEVTAGGGGAIATLTERSPAMLLGNSVRVTAFSPDPALGTVRVWDADAIDLNLLTEYVHRSDVLRTAPTPAASGTGNFAIRYDVPGALPWHNIIMPQNGASGLGLFPVYIDPREASDINLQIRIGAAADYAASNVSSIASTTIHLYAAEVLDPPPPGSPHFWPSWVQQRVGTSNASVSIDAQAIGGGYCGMVSFHTRDDSASGDSRRVNGLVRKVKALHRGDLLLDERWEAMQETTNILGGWRQTTALSGFAVWEPDKERDGLALLDLTRDPLAIQLDTSTGVMQGTTAVTPASNDLCIVTAQMLLPNSAAKKILAGS